MRPDRQIRAALVEEIGHDDFIYQYNGRGSVLLLIGGKELDGFDPDRVAWLAERQGRVISRTGQHRFRLQVDLGLLPA